MKRIKFSFFIVMIACFAAAQPSSLGINEPSTEPNRANLNFDINNVYLFIEDTLINNRLEVNHILILTSANTTVDKKTKLIHGDGPYLKLILSPEHNSVSNEYDMAPLTPSKSFAFGEFLTDQPSMPISIFQSGRLSIKENEDGISLQIKGHLLSPKASNAMYMVNHYRGKCEEYVLLDGK